MSLQASLQAALKSKQVKNEKTLPAPPPPPPPVIIKKDNSETSNKKPAAGDSLKQVLANRSGGQKKDFDEEYKSKPLYQTNLLACGNGKLAQGIGNASSLHVFTFCKSVEEKLIFSKISCGAGHTLGLTPQNIVWGKCHFGQLGHGEENVDCHLPKPVRGILEGKKIRDVGCGWSYSFAVGEQGELYTWGCGYYGAMGTGVEKSHFTPVIVPFFSIEEISKDDGKQVVKVSGGSYHAAVLTKSKHIYSFGRNLSGQLGLGDTLQRISPTLISSYLLSDNSPSPSLLSFVDVSCGDDHTAMIDENGKLYITGLGQLHPKIEDQFQNKKLRSVVTGIRQTLVVDSEGDIYEQKAPIKEFTHLPLDKGMKVSAIGRGETHSMCITTSGQLYTWGDNYCNKLGHHGSFTPKKVDLSVPVSSVDGGSNHIFVLL